MDVRQTILKLWWKLKTKGELKGVYVDNIFYLFLDHYLQKERKQKYRAFNLNIHCRDTA